MARSVRETLDEARNIIAVFRDCLLGANTVTPTPQGTARLLMIRDDRVALLASRSAVVHNELSEEIGRLSQEDHGQGQGRESGSN